MKLRYLLLVLSISGCMSPEQIAARNAQQALEIETQKQQYCAKMGAPFGSNNYYDCRKGLEQQIASEQMQQQQIEQQRYLQNQARINQQHMQDQQFFTNFGQRSYGNPNKMDCTTTRLGNDLNTSCR